MAQDGRLSAKLSAKQEQAITALLTAGTVRAAAKAFDIGERTLYRWLQDPVFQDRLKAAQAEALDATVRQLTDAASLAVVVLRTVLCAPTAKDSVKVRAADVILSRVIVLRETLELEKRIAQLEERLKT